MARKPRFNLPGVPQHVVQRGNNREPCFFAEAYYQGYKHYLQEAAERKKLDDEACGEIETAHPGYLGSQDTFSVGTFKGVSRVYQQTDVDTYAKTAHCKPSRPKHPLQQQTCSTTVSCLSMPHMSYPCCVSSLFEAPSAAAERRWLHLKMGKRSGWKNS